MKAEHLYHQHEEDDFEIKLGSSHTVPDEKDDQYSQKINRQLEMKSVPVKEFDLDTSDGETSRGLKTMREVVERIASK